MPRLQKGESKYKYHREDVIRKKELDSIFDQIGLISYMRARELLVILFNFLRKV